MSKKIISTGAVAPPGSDGDTILIAMDACTTTTVMFEQGDTTLAVGIKTAINGTVAVQIRNVEGDLPSEIKVDLSHLVNVAAGEILQKLKKELIESKQLKLMVANSKQRALFETPTSE